MGGRLDVLWFLAVAWPALFGLPGLKSGLLAPASGTFETLLAGATVGAVLLSLAAIASLVRCLSRPKLSYASIAGAVASAAYFCVFVAAVFWMAGARDDLVDRMNPVMNPISMSAGKLDRLCDHTNLKMPRLGARLLYRELGVCLAYRGDDNSLLNFEPTEKERADRARTITMRNETMSLQDRLRRQAHLARAAGFVYLGAFPFVSGFYLLWIKRKARELANSRPEASRNE